MFLYFLLCPCSAFTNSRCHLSFRASSFGLANRTRGGKTISVGLMGSIISDHCGPCVAAPLAGALLYIGQTGDVALGGVALFSMAIGMGVPCWSLVLQQERCYQKPGRGCYRSSVLRNSARRCYLYDLPDHTFGDSHGTMGCSAHCLRNVFESTGPSS